MSLGPPSAPLPSQRPLFSFWGCQVHTPRFTHFLVHVHTDTHIYLGPQTNKCEGKHSNDHSGATSSHSPPDLSHHHHAVTALSSCPSLAPAWLRVWPGGPSPTGGSGWVGLLKAHCHPTWISAGPGEPERWVGGEGALHPQLGAGPPSPTHPLAGSF